MSGGVTCEVGSHVRRSRHTSGGHVSGGVTCQVGSRVRGSREGHLGLADKLEIEVLEHGAEDHHSLVPADPDVNYRKPSSCGDVVAVVCVR
eukprot:2666757-Rhodomonas_salina.2